MGIKIYKNKNKKSNNYKIYGNQFTKKIIFKIYYKHKDVTF